MAMKKLKNVIEFHSIYPEFSHVFIGDNGQADVKVAEMLKERFGDTLEASFIHEVQPLDRTFCYDENSLHKWQSMNIIFFKTYIGAGVKAAKMGLLSARGLKRVCVNTVRDFVLINPSRFYGGLIKREERRIEIMKDLEEANSFLLASSCVKLISCPLSLCLFPVGSTVYTQFFGEAFVRAFQGESGIYEVSLFQGKLIGFFSAKDLKEKQWKVKGLFKGKEDDRVQQHVTVGSKINTIYGEGKKEEKKKKCERQLRNEKAWFEDIVQLTKCWKCKC